MTVFILYPIPPRAFKNSVCYCVWSERPMSRYHLRNMITYVFVRPLATRFMFGMSFLGHSFLPCLPVFIFAVWSFLSLHFIWISSGCVIQFLVHSPSDSSIYNLNVSYYYLSYTLAKFLLVIFFVFFEQYFYISSTKTYNS